MDSVSQFALGAAVAAAALGRRTGALRAVLWGGAIATLPDLDVLIDHGDAIEDMTRHRGHSHSLFWLTLVSPLLAWLVATLHRERDRFHRWWLAVWLALFTHPLLDALTVYGTQLLQPFDDHPFAIGSLFVIDPLYTLPLIAGLSVLVWRRDDGGRRWNRIGLAVSTVYALWSLGAQQYVRRVAAAALRAQGIESERLLVTPAPLQTVVWRIVARTDRQLHEGVFSLSDDPDSLRFESFDRGVELLGRLRGTRSVDRLEWFTGGFVKLEQVGSSVRIADVRMGAEPAYAFSFDVARVDDGGVLRPVEHPVRRAFDLDAARTGAWLWRRIRGHRDDPPR